MKNNYTPETRFPGYTEEWKQIRLGDRAVIKGRLGWKSLKQEEYTSDGPSMIAGKHINNGIIDWDIVDHIPQWRYDESPEIMLKNGDVIFSKDGSLGNPALISDLSISATINSTMMLVRVNETLDPSFFYQIMKSEKFERLIYLKVSGSSIPHLFQADMNEFMFLAPLKEEQIKIGGFFKHLDETIALYQQELTTLKQTKKGFLQKMFPKEEQSVPEVRFPGFTEEWKQCKLGDIYDIVSGFAFKMSDYVQVGVPIINGESIQHGNISTKNLNFLPEEFLDKYQNFILNTGDIVLGLNRPITNGNLKIAQVPKDLNGALLYQRAGKIIVLNNSDINFSYQLLGKEVSKFVLKEAVGSDQPFISTTKLKKWLIRVPSSEEEQTKIGLFLKKLDDTITLHQRELDALKETKKAFLQKMFV